MKFNPNPWQTFSILCMLFGETAEEREPTLTKAALDPKLRKDLELAHLVRVVKRGRASHLVLEDDAWDFVVEHLGDELPKTERAAKLLRAVLARLQRQLQSNNQSLADFVNGRADSPTTPDGILSSRVDEDPIRVACLALAHGQIGQRVRLKDLRQRIAMSKDELDRTLLAMQTAGRLVLYKLDNPAEITPEDEQAALLIAGQPRHVVYLEA